MLGFNSESYIVLVLLQIIQWGKQILSIQKEVRLLNVRRHEETV